MVIQYRHDMNVVYHRFFILFLFFLLLFLYVNYCYLYLFCNNIPASVCLQMVFLFFHVDLIKYIIRISPHFIKFNWWNIFRNHPNKKHSANHQANRSRKRYHTMNERQQTSKQKVRLPFSIIGCSIIQGKKWCDYIFFLDFFGFGCKMLLMRIFCSSCLQFEQLMVSIQLFHWSLVYAISLFR